jgi:hypothetical protein
MEPIGGWHLVFYFGNFLADTGIAIFAISVWEFDKKMENYRKGLSESTVADIASLELLTRQHRGLVMIRSSKSISIAVLMIGIIIQLVALLSSILTTTALK